MEQVLRKSERTRQRLIEAAHHVFTEQRFAGTKITDISKRAGNANGLFYRYFSSKEAIFAACLQEFKASLRERSPNSAEFDTDLPKAIRASVEAYWHCYMQYKGVLSGLFEMGAQSKEIATAWAEVRSAGIRQFAYRIERQRERGRCLTLDPKIAAFTILGMLEYTCYQWACQHEYVNQDCAKPEDAIHNLFELIKKMLELDE